MCASAIFVVGTSGIPPKLNYRIVKSLNIFMSPFQCQILVLQDFLKIFKIILRRNKIGLFLKSCALSQTFAFFKNVCEIII